MKNGPDERPRPILGRTKLFALRIIRLYAASPSLLSNQSGSRVGPLELLESARSNMDSPAAAAAGSAPDGGKVFGTFV